VYKEKRLFWLIVSKINSHLILLFWACSGTVQHGRSRQQTKPAYLLGVRKQREKKEGSQDPFGGHALNDLTSYS
jgi:hypothetical protein